MRDLHQQVRASHDLLSLLKAKSRHDIPDRLSQALEHIDQCLCGLLEITRNKVFESHCLRLLCCFNLCGNARMTGPELAVATDRTTNRDHRKSSKPNPIRAQTHQLHHIRGGTYAAIRPDFDSS